MEENNESVRKLKDKWKRRERLKLERKMVLRRKENKKHNEGTRKCEF